MRTAFKTFANFSKPRTSDLDCAVAYDASDSICGLQLFSEDPVKFHTKSTVAIVMFHDIIFVKILINKQPKINSQIPNLDKIFSIVGAIKRGDCSVS